MIMHAYRVLWDWWDMLQKWDLKNIKLHVQFKWLKWMQTFQLQLIFQILFLLLIPILQRLIQWIFFYHLGILSKMDFYCAFYFKLVSKLFMLTEMLFCSPMFLFHTWTPHLQSPGFVLLWYPETDSECLQNQSWKSTKEVI